MKPNKASDRKPVKNQQSMGKALANSLQKCMPFVLTSLLFVGIWVAPGFAIDACDESCLPCHGNSEAAHGEFDHNAAPASGPVLIFSDTDHDDAGQVGAKPYFDVLVDCTICHNTNLPAIHGNDCATCHPTPYDTLGIWGKGCQQGGCHSFYHEESTTAHLPWEFTPYNECGTCHDSSFSVTQNQCLNCHAPYGPGDVTPPVTTSNAQVEYYGPATISFSITDNGKVGIGRTFYQLDGGPVTAAGKNLLIEAPGQHQLDFWSIDQSGNTESAPNHTVFFIGEDTTPPITTSNAQATYNQGAVIILTATDTSTLGVKNTYYRLNDGPTQVGTEVVIPSTSGTIAYTLTFWSEDYAGNIETQNSVNFTVTSGTGTIRLVWGNSDASGSPCPGDPDAEASWTITRGTTNVASGSGSCLDYWSGVNDVPVPVSPTPYTVGVYWWDSYNEYEDQTWFSDIYITTPGQFVRLSY